MSLVLEYENNLNFFLDLEILFYVFKNFIVFGVINLLYGNNLILIYKVVVFYYSYRGSLDQSNQVIQMYGQVIIVIFIISVFVVYFRNNVVLKIYYYLVIFISFFFEGFLLFLWFGGCGYGDEFYLLFRLMVIFINLQMRDFYYDFFRKVVCYWINFVKIGYVGSLRIIFFIVVCNVFLYLNLKDV